jgi:hypothetical protein
MTVGDAAHAAITTAASADAGAVLIAVGVFVLCCVLSWLTSAWP